MKVEADKKHLEEMLNKTQSSLGKKENELNIQVQNIRNEVEERVKDILLK